MGEVEPDLEVDDGLADDAEAKVSRLDDAGMYGANGNFVDTLAADWLEWEWRAIVLEMRRDSIFA